MWEKLICILMVLLSGQRAAWTVNSFRDYVARIKEAKLENGLTVIMYEDPTIRRAVCHLFIGVGSRNECPGTTGISHLIEHLYMPGKRPGDQPGDDLSGIGGSTGAHTYADFTDVIVTVPADRVEVAVRMMANRFRDLAATQERVEAEKRIVMNERLLLENGPTTNMLIEQLWALAFAAHPYRNPVGGWPADIQSITASEVNRYFKTYYAPNNAVLVLGGNIKSEEALAHVRTYWRAIPAHPLPDITITAEPEQHGPKRALYHRKASQPAIAIGYKIPSFTHPDRFALDALNVILIDGATSRLSRALRARQLVPSFETTLTPLARRRDVSLLPIVATLAANANAEEAEAIIYREIERLAEEPVTERELQKAKNKLETQFYSYIVHQSWTLYSPGGKTMQIGYYQWLAGDYRFMAEVIERYQKLTPNDLLKAARKYLNPKNRTTIILIPEAEKK